MHPHTRAHLYATTQKRTMCTDFLLLFAVNTLRLAAGSLQQLSNIRIIQFINEFIHFFYKQFRFITIKKTHTFPLVGVEKFPRFHCLQISARNAIDFV